MYVKVKVIAEKTPGPCHFETIKFRDKLAHVRRSSAFSFGRQKKFSIFLEIIKKK